MRKNLNIEVFRGLAVTLVIITHSFFIPFFTYLNQEFDMDRGVDLFFIISGYLMGATYISKLNLSTFEFKKAYNFYIKRLSRLLPAVIFWSIIMLIANLIIFKDSIFQYQYIALSAFFF